MDTLANLHLSQAAHHVINIGGAALTLFLLYIVGQAIYNVYFSPLRSYPGPKLWAASRLPLFYHRLKGDAHFTTLRLHEKYGPVVRLAPTDLSYTSGQAWKDIYGHRSDELQKVSDGRGVLTPAPNGAHNIILAPRDVHSRMRRNLAHAFSAKALAEQESYIQMYVDNLINGLKKQGANAAPVDMMKWYNFTTFDVIGDLSFGEPFGCTETGQVHTWITTIFKAIQAGPWIQFATFYKIAPRFWKYIMPKGLAEARMDNFKISAEKMDRRLAKDEDRKDFTSFMTKYNDDKGLSVPELRNMAVTLIVAGSETTATLLSGATYYILRNPAVYEQLVKEIRDKFTYEEDITIKAVSDMKYVLAVLEESLRIYPPAPSIFPRVVPEGGVTIDGKFVPGNTIVGVHQLSTFRMERNFHKPYEFHPERWLPEGEGGSPEFANDDKTAFQPFSTGPRNCIGKNLAYAEMRVILARVLFNFDLKLVTAPGWEIQKAPFLWQKPPLMVSVTPRDI